MREFEQKRKFRKVIYSRPSIAVLFLVIIFLSIEIWGWYGKYRESSQKRDIAEHELAKLKEREHILVNEIAALKTKRGLEEEVRFKYGYALPGEQVAIIVDNPETVKNFPREGAFETLGGWWAYLKAFFQ